MSGNPGGFPKDLHPLILKCRRLALSHAPKAIERLAAMLDSKEERVVVAAAEGLLDRAGLRPFALEPERVEVTTPVDVDALRAALAVRVAALAPTVEVGALPLPGPTICCPGKRALRPPRIPPPWMLVVRSVVRSRPFRLETPTPRRASSPRARRDFREAF